MRCLRESIFGGCAYDSGGGSFYKKVVVVVPAFNEGESIQTVAESLDREGFDYVVVNDGSIDDTAAILDSHHIPHIDLIENLGIGGAVQTGYKYAYLHGYDIAVQFDGDGQHDVACISEIIAPLLCEEADIVVGSRFVGDRSSFRSSMIRRIGISILSKILRLVSGKEIKDVTSGFRAIDRRALALFSDSYPSDYPEPESLALALSSGMTVREVPVAMHERSHGSSSISGFSSMWYMVKVALSILIVGLFRREGKSK